MIARLAPANHSFRARIVRFGLLLVTVVGLPAAIFALWQPWRRLYQIIDETELLLKTIEPAIFEEDLRAMNGFALEMAGQLYAAAEESNGEDRVIAREQAFNSLIIEGRMLSEAELLAALAAADEDPPDYDYVEFERWATFWETEMAKRPGLRERLRHYRNLLSRAQEAASEAGLAAESIYLTVDRGSVAEGFFAENIAFVIEGSTWWDSTHPGEPFNLVENDTLDWREAYDLVQGGQPDFYHNTVFDPQHFYLPDFETDEWGTYFTSWQAKIARDESRRDIYSVLNIDIEASDIVGLMQRIGLGVVVTVGLLSLLILAITGRLSGRLSKPIVALTEGAEAVMAQHYDHVVPEVDQQEFQRLVDVFNSMIHSVGERVNLHETLTKLLSEELADEAAASGLVLGGQRVDCTILYTDFAGFSSLTPLMTPEQTVRLLNVYYAELIPIIKQHGGFPDKYIGDAIVAIFGAPVMLKDHAVRAVRCAVAMQAKMREINDERIARSEPVFEMRVGLDTGEVVAGAIGCDLKMEYTSIGEATNLANRMESRCPLGHALISENTCAALAGVDTGAHAILATEGREIVKGYPDGVRAFVMVMHDRLITRPERVTVATDFYHYQSASPETIVASIAD